MNLVAFSIVTLAVPSLVKSANLYVPSVFRKNVRKLGPKE